MVFKNFLKLKEYRLTTDAVDFINYDGPKFSYGDKPLGDELFFKAEGLLTQRGIHEQTINVEEQNGIPTFFAVKDAAMPYDPFAAVFYMLSRYEEYLPHLRDIHDRFPLNQSLAFQENFHHKAVVDRWCLQLKSFLNEQFEGLKFEERQYVFLPTYDIDNAYAYRQKGVLRTVGALAKNLIKLKFGKIKVQLLVLLGQRKDPFDTYHYQMNLQRKYNLTPIYFFLLGDYGNNDKNLSHENRHFQSLIKRIADYAQVGIHPSYNSNDDEDKIRTEIRRLERIVKRDVLKSRQHFLKINFPSTYRSLLEADITEDYSLGFAADIGFRAGTCTPFTFYDLDEELERNLLLKPFQIMESSLKYYQKLSAEEAMNHLKPIVDEVKAVGGTLISLWHNESLSDEDEWEGWRKVYDDFIQYASPTIKLK